MADRILDVLAVSPWSERARWALDHHRLPYRSVEHAPFIGEGRLRKLVGPTAVRATVPVLRAGSLVLTESTEIARYADKNGAGTPLFPAGRDADVAVWVTTADQTSDAGRLMITAQLLRSPKALDETLGPLVPVPLRPLLRPVARYGTRWFARKYRLDLDDTAAAEAVVRTALDVIRARLATSSPYLGSFSYADIVAAVVLQMVRPVEHERYPLPPALRAVWTSSSMSSAYPDLLEWRDELYRKHRGEPRSATRVLA